jgi:hypothetical protein
MGTNISFSVTASGTTPLFYVWESGSAFSGIGRNVVFDNSRITGSHYTGGFSSTLYINNVQYNDSGSYRVRVTNMVSYSVSQEAVLYITSSGSPPLIIFHPKNQETLEYSTASFAATVVGTMPMTFQWISGSTNLSDDSRIHGANSMSVIIENVLSADTGSYRLYAVNPYGESYSDYASLILISNIIPYYINDTSSVSVSTLYGSTDKNSNNEYFGTVNLGLISGSLTTIIVSTNGDDSGSFNTSFYSASLISAIIVTIGSDSGSFDMSFYSASLSTVVVATAESQDSGSFDTSFYSASLSTIVIETFQSDGSGMSNFSLGLISGSLTG